MSYEILKILNNPSACAGVIFSIQPGDKLIIEGEIEYSHLNEYNKNEIQNANKQKTGRSADYKISENTKGYRKIVINNPRAAFTTNPELVKWFGQHVYSTRDGLRTQYNWDGTANYTPKHFQATLNQWDNPVEVTDSSVENFAKGSTYVSSSTFSKALRQIGTLVLMPFKVILTLNHIILVLRKTSIH
ncbi:hypothetical protein [Lactococcus termiticola]|uniref:Uncharacterized protein n=1 Tax=Lactococcus termiticola TaxID=2169526 RepID=A0A2R5HHD6_9LACT|nr:hypothetical protein [Lactococcus termiticola]GBG97424.1 hypothetical protein NtB2_01569 [Lactococcus termiticola]